MLSMSELNQELKVKLRNQKFMINTVKSYTVKLIMPQIRSHRPQPFKRSLTLLAGNAKNYILCGIHIDEVKVYYQNNHTVDCKLVLKGSVVC